MRYREIIREAIHDPHIFKAVFLAGAAGSGKSTVARKLFGGTGLRFVDMDNFSRMYRKTGRTSPSRSEIRQHVKNQRDSLMQGRIGMVIDGTGRYPPDIIRVNRQLQSVGYETKLLFVNVDLEKSLSRTADRAKRPGVDFGREIPADHVQHMWHEVNDNRWQLEQEFGLDFVLLDNNSDGVADLTDVQKMFNSWLQSAPRSNAARDWIKNSKNTSY
jgi:adenylate kinase family enzyme